MSWHFSQALEAEYSRASCLDGEQSVRWRSTPMRVPSIEAIVMIAGEALAAWDVKP